MKQPLTVKPRGATIHSMKKIIEIVSPCVGGGATFVATNLSLIMGRYQDGVAYLEGRQHTDHSLPFYELSLDKHINKKRLVDFSELKSLGKPTDNRVNLYDNVNWAVRLTDSLGEQAVLSEVEPHDIAGRYILWDSGTRNGCREKSCSEPDLILCVIDTLPSKVLAAAENIEELKARYHDKIRWVFNRSEAKTITEAEKFLGIKGDFSISEEAAEKIAESQRVGVALAAKNSEKSRHLPTLSPKIRSEFDEIASYIFTLY